MAQRSESRDRFWNNPRFLAVVYQALLMTGLVAFGAFLVQNTLANLAKQGISSGFGFLSHVASFDISETLIEYTSASSYARAFLVAVLNTFFVSAWAIIFSTIIGFLAGVARLSSNWLLAKLTWLYVEATRNVPLLLQVFFWYFAVLKPLPGPRQSLDLFGSIHLCNRGLIFPKPVPENGFEVVIASLLTAVILSFAAVRLSRRRQDRTGKTFPVIWTCAALLLGLPSIAFILMNEPLHFEHPVLKGFNFWGGMTLSPEFVALCVALSLYIGAFIAEIVRAGILSVNKGQLEAATSLGLRPGLSLRLVVIPQALRVIIPPLASMYLTTVKDSSLAAAIGYPDLVLVFAGTVLLQTGLAVEVIAMTMGVYLVSSLTISGLMNWYNKITAIKER
ncbi:MAG: amino acid ABC transporter permease [Thermodesulfobacteriota bacterium]